MVRPTYETEADLSREENIARYAARKWDCAMRKQDKYNQFDYLIIKGKDVKAFVEIRTRTHIKGTYPTCFVSANKVQAAFSMRLATGLPSIFLVGWKDCIGWASLTEIYKITMGGRTDRGDPADIEAVAEIPIEKFNIFK